MHRHRFSPMVDPLRSIHPTAAASAEEASSSMKQMAANIKQNADNALQMKRDS